MIAQCHIVSLGRCLERLQIGGVELIPVSEAGGFIPLEQIELVGLRELDFLCEFLPIVRTVGFRHVDDAYEVVGFMDATEVSCSEAHAFECSELFGGEFEKERLPLVRACGVFHSLRTQFIADHTTRDFILVEKTGHYLVKHIDIADHRGGQSGPIHEQENLVELAHVITELRNDPLRSGFCGPA